MANSSSIKKPIVIYVTDLLKILPHLTSKRGAYYRYSQIKKHFNKKNHQFLTVKEVSNFEGIPENLILEILQ